MKGFGNASDNEDWERWLSDKPEVIQALAREYPAGSTIVQPDGTQYFVTGYTEDGDLMCADVDPLLDFEAAMSDEHTVYFCANCLRNADKTVSVIHTH